jgi:hypothetical protein
MFRLARCLRRCSLASGFVRSQDRVVINLPPAELPKSAGSFDFADCGRHSCRQRAVQE